MPIVIDASIAMAWSFPDERDAESIAAGRHVLIEHAIVPALWRWEVQNVLVNAERRGRVTADTINDILRALHALPIAVDAPPPVPAFGAELQLARRFTLSVYDAAYLELAARRGMRLATKDVALRAAASTLGLLWTSQPESPRIIPSAVEGPPPTRRTQATSEK
jgi:predicted nucleic acid-binding protein